MATPADADSAEPVRVAVIVPSYRRPELLRRCLAALRAQTDPADEILVVHRADDAATAAVVDTWPDVSAVHVIDPGVVAAMRAGASAAPSEVVAFTDDDAAPRPDWLATLRPHFGDPSVGAVGGRDVVDRPTQTGPLTEHVGLVERWGQLTGNHHLGTGAPRDVAVLKGANMAFRRSALALPTSLRGAGAQVDFELACCISAADAGWRIVYDPAAIVDHTVGPRFDADRRGAPDPAAVSDAAYNRLSILLALRPMLGLRRAAFGLLVGERATPGLLRTMVALARGERDVVRRFLPSVSGQLAAIADVVRGRRVRMMPTDHATLAGPTRRPSSSTTP